jgi:hypothetical protein
MRMAHAAPPNPLGLLKDDIHIDSGTLAPTQSPRPGPSGLAILGPFPMQARSTTRQSGIEVHAESEITAADWVKKIAASDSVPARFKPNIKSNGNVLYITNPKKFKERGSNKLSLRWIDSWVAAFPQNDWEVTTGVLDITVRRGKSPQIEAVHRPDLSRGETVDNYTQHTMTEKGESTDKLPLERGNTLPIGVKLKSKRRAIVIANRVRLDLDGAVKTYRMTDSELVATLFHELAAHAGRFDPDDPMSSAHGDPTVDLYALDVEGMFPETTTVPKVFVEIDNHLQAKQGVKR